MACLRVLSLNCHGWNLGVKCYLQGVLDCFDVFLLQETWLSDNSSNSLSELSSEFVCFHSSAMEDRLQSGVFTGRPFGGTAVLIRRCFAARVCRVVTNSARVTAVRLSNYDEPDVIIASLYMPFNDRSVKQFDEFLSSVGCLQGLLDAHVGCHFLLGGDLNTVKSCTNGASLCLQNFCRSNGMCWVDSDIHSVDYTYHCDAANHFSLIDYFICSPMILDCNVKSRIIVDGANTSDHYAISISIRMSMNCSSSVPKIHTAKWCWDRADFAQYKAVSDNLLSHINIPCEALLCTDGNCVQHCQALDDYYSNLVNCLTEAANFVVPKVKSNVEKPWWSPDLTTLKRECQHITQIWRSCGCPRAGTLNQMRTQTKLRYKCAIKDAIVAYESEFSDDLVAKFCSKDLKSFWKSWKKRFCSKDLTPTDRLNGKMGHAGVLSEFASHFQKVGRPNTPKADDIFREKVCTYLNLHRQHGAIPHIDVTTMFDLISSLKLRKAGGHDGLLNEHIVYASSNIAVHLSLLFTALIRHSFVPDSFRTGIIKPLLKTKHGDRTKLDMYRGITLTPVISKLFESILLELYGKFLCSDPLQFGFKANTGCNDALFTLTESVKYFNKRDSKVFCALLDASKAFDKVLINGLLWILITRDVPVEFVHLLFNWFSDLRCSVMWMSLMSAPFAVYCGVRQGGVLSPVLFSVYVDDLILQLRSSGLGIHVGSVFCGCIFYADDIVLLSASCLGLQRLLDICSKYGFELDIKFNPDKSFLCAFGSNPPQTRHITLSGKPLEWVDSVKYLGCILKCRSVEIDTASFIRKFYGSFNNILRVLGSKRDEMISLHFSKTYCLPHLLYCCEAWHVRSDNVRQLNVAWNNSFRKIFKSFWFESVKPLQFYCYCLPLDFVINQRRMLFWKKCSASGNVVVRTLASCCTYAVNSVCSLFGLSVIDLVRLPVWKIKDYVWQAFTRIVAV